MFFKNDALTIPGDYTTVTGADGAVYGVLTFHQFMVRFVSDRFVTFQIASGSEDGLKIPRSSITENNTVNQFVKGFYFVLWLLRNTRST